MAIDKRQQDAEVVAKRQADDARFQAEQRIAQDKMIQDRAQEAKVLADRKAEEAGAPARRAQEEAANRGILGAVVGISGGVAGLALMNKLEGVTPIATLSGPQNGNVIQNIAQQAGFNVASPTANGPAATGPQNIMNTAMAFLTPPKQNGP